ncbi:MAG: hypothetical protein ACHQAW_03740 [Actinomycetota bacterium]|jgi:hypothetical protein
MTEEPRADDAETEPEETDWAEEIKRLRAARGEQLAARLAEDTDKEPPVS